MINPATANPQVFHLDGASVCMSSNPSHQVAAAESAKNCCPEIRGHVPGACPHRQVQGGDKRKRHSSFPEPAIDPIHQENGDQVR